MGDGHGADVLLADAQVQRLHAPQQQVGRHRIQRRAVDLPVVVDALDQLAVAADDAAQGVGMAAQILGGAVHDQVGAQRQRVGVDGRGKGVVDDDGGAGPMPGFGQPRDVHDLERGIGRAFQVEHACSPWSSRPRWPRGRWCRTGRRRY